MIMLIGGLPLGHRYILQQIVTNDMLQLLPMDRIDRNELSGAMHSQTLFPAIKRSMAL